MEESLTRYGAVETIKEGALFADFLEQHKGEYDGIIMSFPNFGDENGASVARATQTFPSWFRHFPMSLPKWTLHTAAMPCAGNWPCVTFCASSRPNKP